MKTLEVKIALRYLLSHKSHNAVNILSMVSVAGVAVAAAAMVIVLSVFNGFGDMAAERLSTLDPDLLVKPARGTVIERADSLTAALRGIPGVTGVYPAISHHALAVSGDDQLPVTIMGLDDDAVAASSLDAATIDGRAAVTDPAAGTPAAILSVGAANATRLRADPLASISIYVPRRTGRLNPSNPMAAFRGDTLGVAGVYSVAQPEYDTDMVIVPLDRARRLLGYSDSQAHSLRVHTLPGHAGEVGDAVRHALPAGLVVLDRYRQQQQAFNMIAVEKWVTFMMLAAILVITSFNIISSIYILRLEKRGNTAVMRAMGFTRGMTRRVFTWQGTLITLAGGAIGIVLGSLLTLAQQHLGMIKLNAGNPGNLSLDAYPVRLDGIDLLATAAVITVIAVICALIASAGAGKMGTGNGNREPGTRNQKPGTRNEERGTRNRGVPPMIKTS